MRRNRSDRELQRVVKRLFPLVPTGHAVVKSEFEAIHAEVLACVRRGKVLAAMRLEETYADKRRGSRDLPSGACIMNLPVSVADVIQDQARSCIVPS